MPIAQDRTPIVQNDLPVNVASPEYKGVTVDTYRINLAELMVYLEGSNWTTEYYSQVINEENELNPHDPDLPAPYQQYTQIKNFELKVNDPLTHSQNTQTNEFEIRGSATVYPGTVKANAGDMFLADIGDGREGVFTVLSSEKKSIFLSAAYVIEYMLVAVNGEEKRLELAEKIVKTVFFKKDMLLHGQNPLLIEEEVLTIDKVNRYYETVKNYYFAKFFSKEYSTLLVPNQGVSLYDPYLVKAVTDLFDNSEHPVLQNLRHVNIHGNSRIEQKTFWDALLNLDHTQLNFAVNEFWCVSGENWPKLALMKSFRYSGIKTILFPKEPIETVDTQLTVYPEIEGEDLNDTTRRDVDGNWIPWVDPALEEPVDGEVVVPVIPLYRPVTIDNKYVFSNAFYTQDQEGQSVIEVQTNNLLKNIQLDMTQISRLCDDFSNWGLLEQFYYGPVLIVLMKAVVRKM